VAQLRSSFCVTGVEASSVSWRNRSDDPRGSSHDSKGDLISAGPRNLGFVLAPFEVRYPMWRSESGRERWRRAAIRKCLAGRIDCRPRRRSPRGRARSGGDWTGTLAPPALRWCHCDSRLAAARWRSLPRSRQRGRRTGFGPVGSRSRIVLGRFDVTAVAGGENGYEEWSEEPGVVHHRSPVRGIQDACDFRERRVYSGR
jgi:hypothetical protein